LGELPNAAGDVMGDAVGGDADSPVTTTGDGDRGRRSGDELRPFSPLAELFGTMLSALPLRPDG
jgi:hypothetical protein